MTARDPQGGRRVPGLPPWLRTLIILITLPPWLATVAVYLLRGEPPPAGILTIPLGLVAATSAPGIVAEVGRRVLAAQDPASPGAAPTQEGGQS